MYLCSGVSMIFDLLLSVIEDYFKLVSELIEQCPTLLCQSSFLPALFSCAAACLAVEHTEALFAVIGFLRDVTALASPLRAHIPTLIAEPLVLVVQQNIQDLVRRIFNGLIYSFSRDRELFFDVAGILKTVSEVAPEETRQAVQVVVHEFSDEQMGPKEKEDFLAKYARYGQKI
ncbi:hypothetical protein DFJ77DRAFT_105818 [Powellomyces hirtus]|nr:hypothetical protein DFJ77DRAFT_105818 [Powellomyces hirtus]